MKTAWPITGARGKALNDELGPDIHLLGESDILDAIPQLPLDREEAIKFARQIEAVTISRLKSLEKIRGKLRVFFSSRNGEFSFTRAPRPDTSTPEKA